MQTKTEAIRSLHNLNSLPAFAEYILTHRLTEYVQEQLRLSREFNLPLLKLLDKLTEDELLALSKKGASELLTYLAENRAEEQIRETIRRWTENQLPQIDKDDIQADDINLGFYIRKRTFLHFVPEYCRDTEQIIELIKEIDLYCLQAAALSTNTYIRLLKNKIDEHSHFIEKITDTSPGIIYVYDVVNNMEVYTNKAITDTLGYEPHEFINLQSNFVEELIHPEDVPVIKAHEESFSNVKDGEIRSVKYRIRNKEGDYKWLRAYETAFKRDEDGKITQKIGIAIDVHQQKITADKLLKREEELLEAQEIAQFGSFTWDFETKNYTASPQLYSILEIEDTSFTGFMQRIHPEDHQKLTEAIEKSKKTGYFECEYRYQFPGREKVLWSKGRVSFNEDKAVSMTGTVMDITERTVLLNQLKKNEALYKQAEAITHIGNYKWDLKTNELIWSEELYRIYGLDPEKDSITYDYIEHFNHPDDTEMVRREIASAINQRTPFDFYYRINPETGTQKILHARGNVMPNGSEPTYVIGTVQDVTEKQQLIQKLRHSESIYKQAEELGNMGNWSWDLKTNKVEWTDHLYRIYGLEPQSEEITIDRFLSFVHPEDRPNIEKGIAISTEKYLDYVFRIISKDGKVKTLRSVAFIQTDDKGEPLYVIGTERDITEKQNLINNLRQSENLYKQAQALAHLGNWTMELDSRHYTWSDEMYKIYEITSEENISFEEWTNFIHPEERDQVITYLEECIREHKIYDRIHRIILRNGKIKTLHRKGEFIYNEKGEAIRMIGTTQDVTEEQRVQQELKENQIFIKKIADATPSIIASYNINSGKYVFISEGLQKLLGYDPQKALQDGVAFFTDIIHPDDLMPVMERNAKALQEANAMDENSKFIVEFTYRMRHKNGKYRWFNTYGTVFDRNTAGKVEHVLNISLDVTDQVAASQKIQEQEHFIQQIADASPTILYLFDVTTQKMAYANRELFYVLGFTPEAALEMGSEITSSLYHQEDFDLLPEREQSSKRFQHRDSMMQYECRMKTVDGDYKWMLVREIIFKTDDDGKVLQILGAALDISKRKDMERTILMNSFQLEQSNASLEEFAYVASHDLKEPLRKISTFGDRLIATQKERLSDDGKIYLNKIIDASQRMQTMISDLLAVSMITGDRGYQPYRLHDILTDVLQTLEYKIEQKKATISTTELPEANIIPSQFRQLFQNLLSNSLKFTKEGVQPIINITHSYLSPEELSGHQLQKATQYLKLEFSDNGIGFEDEYAGKIFAIFQRLHGRSEYEGTGIGLAICKKIVEHHGGMIYASGVPDIGAKFTIILPA